MTLSKTPSVPWRVPHIKSRKQGEFFASPSSALIVEWFRDPIQSNPVTHFINPSIQTRSDHIFGIRWYLGNTLGISQGYYGDILPRYYLWNILRISRCLGDCLGMPEGCQGVFWEISWAFRHKTLPIKIQGVFLAGAPLKSVRLQSKSYQKSFKCQNLLTGWHLGFVGAHFSLKTTPNYKNLPLFTENYPPFIENFGPPPYRKL